MGSFSISARSENFMRGLRARLADCFHGIFAPFFTCPDPDQEPDPWRSERLLPLTWAAALHRLLIVVCSYDVVRAADEPIRDSGEPSFSFTTPVTPTETDDGLLTVSEVARLPVKSTYVVLLSASEVEEELSPSEVEHGLPASLLGEMYRSAAVPKVDLGSPIHVPRLRAILALLKVCLAPPRGLAACASERLRRLISAIPSLRASVLPLRRQGPPALRPAGA